MTTDREATRTSDLGTRMAALVAQAIGLAFISACGVAAVVAFATAALGGA